MRIAKVVFYINSPLAIRGLMHYIHSLVPGIKAEIIDAHAKLVVANEPIPGLVIIDPILLSAPPHLTLEKIRRTAPQNIFIAFTEKEIPEQLQPYFDFTISLLDEEEILIRKMTQVFHVDEELAASKDENRLLSDRETEVLKWVALGKTNKEISDTLNISAHTVITHRKNITAKLGIKTIAGLTVFAILNGIISQESLKS